MVGRCRLIGDWDGGLGGTRWLLWKKRPREKGGQGRCVSRNSKGCNDRVAARCLDSGWTTTRKKVSRLSYRTQNSVNRQLRLKQAKWKENNWGFGSELIT